VLDVLQQRAPWVHEAVGIWQAMSSRKIEACVSASAVTDLFYISRRMVGKPAALKIVRAVLDEMTVLPVDRKQLDDAYSLSLADFEDALQVVVARDNGLDALVTRDAAGFKGSPVTVLTPADLLAHI
jgi:predicted nucleic acid-binding protein